jgi:hypothetical protein
MFKTRITENRELYKESKKKAFYVPKPAFFNISVSGIWPVYIFQITLRSVFFESERHFRIGEKCNIWLPGLSWVEITISRHSGNLFAAIFSEPIESNIVRQVRVSGWTSPRESIKSVELRSSYPFIQENNIRFELTVVAVFGMFFIIVSLL